MTNMNHEFTCYDLAEDSSLERLDRIKIDFAPRYGDVIRLQLWDNRTKDFYPYTGEVQKIIIDVDHRGIAKNKILLRRIEYEL